MLSRIKHLTHIALKHHGFRRYFINTSWMFGEQVLRIISSLLVGIWVARYMGPEQYGVFSYAVAFVAIFAGIAKLGLDNIIVRDLVNEPEKRDLYLGTAFWLKLVAGLLTIVVIAIGLLFTANDTATNVYILVISAGIVFQSFDVIDYYFQSRVLAKFISLCKGFQLLISASLRVYLVLIKADLIYFVWVILADQLALALSLYLAYRYQKLGSFYKYFNLKIAKDLLHNSWPLIFSSLAVAVYMRIDQVMIQQMLGNREAGIYSAAVRLSETWYFIPVIITSSVAPAIISARNVSKELYIKRLQKLCTVMVWIAILLAVFISFFSSAVLYILFGSAYQASNGVLVIQIWGSVFVFMGAVSNIFFSAENYTRKSLYRTSIGALLNVMLNYVMIPVYGIQGAAFATLISQFVANFAYDLFDKDLKIIRDVKIRSFIPII